MNPISGLRQGTWAWSVRTVARGTSGANLVSRVPESGWPFRLASCPLSDFFWLLEVRVSRTFLDKLRPQLLRPSIPSSMRPHYFLSSLGACRLFEVRVSRTFLDNLRLICSVHRYPARRGSDGGPRRFTEVVLEQQSLSVAGSGSGIPTPPPLRPQVSQSPTGGVSRGDLRSVERRGRETLAERTSCGDSAKSLECPVMRSPWSCTAIGWAPW